MAGAKATRKVFLPRSRDRESSVLKSAAVRDWWQAFFDSCSTALGNNKHGALRASVEDPVARSNEAGRSRMWLSPVTSEPRDGASREASHQPVIGREGLYRCGVPYLSSERRPMAAETLRPKTCREGRMAAAAALAPGLHSPGWASGWVEKARGRPWMVQTCRVEEVVVWRVARRAWCCSGPEGQHAALVASVWSVEEESTGGLGLGWVRQREWSGPVASQHSHAAPLRTTLSHACAVTSRVSPSSVEPKSVVDHEK